VLLFEGSITLLVPLQESVQDEEDRAKFPTVYRRVILSIIGFYALFGITCVVAFGDDVRTVLTTSLPPGTLATTVQLAYSIAVIFTFPLQNFPCLEIVTQSMSRPLLLLLRRRHCHHCGGGGGGGGGGDTGKKRIQFWTQRNVLSSILVLLLACVAVVTMESLDKVVSLMGSLLGCPIAFVFPPLIHSRLDPDISSRRKMTNHAVAALGTVAMILASVTTMMAW
jgi:proton-coupled amino acid transporter